MHLRMSVRYANYVPGGLVRRIRTRGVKRGKAMGGVTNHIHRNGIVCNLRTKKKEQMEHNTESCTFVLHE